MTKHWCITSWGENGLPIFTEFGSSILLAALESSCHGIRAAVLDCLINYTRSPQDKKPGSSQHPCLIMHLSTMVFCSWFIVSCASGPPSFSCHVPVGWFALNPFYYLILVLPCQALFWILYSGYIQHIFATPGLHCLVFVINPHLLENFTSASGYHLYSGY